MVKVGIVLISHSPKVVQGIKDIIGQVNDHVPIALAGGTDDGEIGTSIEKIQTAIDHVSVAGSVLLVYDLGSAKMNAAMAIEMGELKHVRILEAPLLEGAYAASVEAGMGKSLDEVAEAVEKHF